MVQLSPKALRFAELAAEAAAQRPELADDELRVWKIWRSLRYLDPQGTGVGDIPHDTATMFVHAIDIAVSADTGAQNSHLFIEDGNDLEFLKDIKHSLLHDLDLEQQPGRSPRR